MAVQAAWMLPLLGSFRVCAWPTKEDATFYIDGHWTGSSLVHVMACCLLGTKPLSEPMMTRAAESHRLFGFVLRLRFMTPINSLFHFQIFQSILIDFYASAFRRRRHYVFGLSVRPSVRPKPEIPSFDLYIGPLVHPTNRYRFTACPSVRV